jgi:hypothetical protein
VTGIAYIPPGRSPKGFRRRAIPFRWMREALDSGVR